MTMKELVENNKKSLRGADLREAKLSEANLSWAKLSGATLSGANLSGANLSKADGYLCASCSWTDHGECGRELLAVVIDNEPVYFCGCFMGSEGELREYIAKGEEKYKASRTIAFNFVSQRIKEMMEERGVCKSRIV